MQVRIHQDVITCELQVLYLGWKRKIKGKPYIVDGLGHLSVLWNPEFYWR